MSRFLEIAIEGRIEGHAENSPRGRREAERYIFERLARGAQSAEARPTERFTQGTSWLDGSRER